MDDWSVYLVMDREDGGSSPGGIKCFSTRLSFESKSSDISRFMFFIGDVLNNFGTFLSKIFCTLLFGSHGGKFYFSETKFAAVILFMWSF